MGKPRNTRKYPTYPEIPESKKDTRKYPIVYFDTPTRPEPDLLPGILSNTRPDPILKNPTRWALAGVCFGCLYSLGQSDIQRPLYKYWLNRQYT